MATLIDEVAGKVVSNYGLFSPYKIVVVHGAEIVGSFSSEFLPSISHTLELDDKVWTVDGYRYFPAKNKIAMMVK